MRTRLPIVAGMLIAAAVALSTATYASWDEAVPIAAMALNPVRTLTAPAGTSATRQASRFDDAGAVATLALPTTLPSATSNEWPGYSNTLTSERYSPLKQINTMNVGRLKVLCTYDTRQQTSFGSGPIMIHDALIGTTEHDIFSIDAATCHENWRTHENYRAASLLAANRSAAYMDGLLYRGSEDGRVLAYDFNTGKRVWTTTIGDPEPGKSASAAPIAENGFVFIGNAGGDNKGLKGRMYALDGRTGEIVWEFYLVPKSAAGDPITGRAAWKSYTLDPVTGEIFAPGGNPGSDFAIGLREGGNLHSGPVVVPEASIGTYRHHIKKNVEALLAAGKPVRYCPDTAGEPGWDGPAYDPRNNLILIGEVGWCSTLTLQTDARNRKVPPGKPYTGMATRSRYHAHRAPDSSRRRAGWIYAVDADSGTWKWRLKSDYPILGGMTPTAGGLVFFGDAGGNFYALDASKGTRLWGQKIGGAIGGGVITYTTDGEQKVAVATGFTGKIVILGL